MNDILRDFEKKNEIPKIDLSGVDFAMKNINTIFDDIAKDIRERQDNAMAMEFTKCIGELLKKNGITPKITEYTREIAKEHSIEQLYGVSIDELDFSEHDKTFVDRIVELQIKNNHLVDEKNKLREIINKKLGGWDDYGVSFEEIFGMRDENKELKQRIAELESENKQLKHDIDKMATSKSEWIDKAVEWQQKCEKLESKESVKPMRIEFHADNGEMLTPLEVANSLINSGHERPLKENEVSVSGKTSVRVNTFSVNDLKEIADYLQVYCRHNDDRDAISF